MEDQDDGFAENEQLEEELEQAFADEPIRTDNDDDDDDESMAVHTLPPFIFYNYSGLLGLLSVVW